MGNCDRQTNGSAFRDVCRYGNYHTGADELMALGDFRHNIFLHFVAWARVDRTEDVVYDGEERKASAVQVLCDVDYGDDDLYK